MVDLTIAKARRVLAIFHWIGGVALVTLVLRPGLDRLSTLLSGASGFDTTPRLAAWVRFFDIAYRWMHAMVLV
ncbi:MAG: hypothetical protein ABL893_07430 [Hyphomicrobium sp.]|nr:hypothetical protein [Hyphomicrobium sp.]